MNPQPYTIGFSFHVPPARNWDFVIHVWDVVLIGKGLIVVVTISTFQTLFLFLFLYHLLRPGDFHIVLKDDGGGPVQCLL